MTPTGVLVTNLLSPAVLAFVYRLRYGRPAREPLAA